MLETAIAGFDCRLTDVRRVATHDVPIGEVLAVLGGGGTALGYLDRTYRTV